MVDSISVQTYQLIEPLTDDQLLSVIRASLGSRAEIVDCSRLEGGMFNTSYSIRTRNPSHHVVLRVAPRSEYPIRRYERTMILTEPYIYKLIKQLGIPTVNVLAVDGSRSVIDRDYLIMEYIDAVQLRHPSVPVEVQPYIMREVGRYTALMHEVTAEKFGWIMPDNSIRGSESWAEVFGELLAEMCVNCCETGVINQADADAALSFYWKNRSVFDECRRPSFVHNDIWDTNILVSEKDGRWKIEAIIDAERALYADPEFEYAIRDESNKDLMLGYSRHLDPSPNAVLRRKFYHLELHMLYAWYHLVMYPSPDFQAHAARVVMEILNEFSS